MLIIVVIASSLTTESTAVYIRVLPICDSVMKTDSC